MQRIHAKECLRNTNILPQQFNSVIKLQLLKLNYVT